MSIFDIFRHFSKSTRDGPKRFPECVKASCAVPIAQIIVQIDLLSDEIRVFDQLLQKIDKLLQKNDCRMKTAEELLQTNLCRRIPAELTRGGPKRWPECVGASCAVRIAQMSVQIHLLSDVIRVSGEDDCSMNTAEELLQRNLCRRISAEKILPTHYCRRTIFDPQEECFAPNLRQSMTEAPQVHSLPRRVPTSHFEVEAKQVLERI